MSLSLFPGLILLELFRVNMKFMCACSARGIKKWTPEIKETYSRREYTTIKKAALTAFHINFNFRRFYWFFIPAIDYANKFAGYCRFRLSLARFAIRSKKCLRALILRVIYRGCVGCLLEICENYVECIGKTTIGVFLGKVWVKFWIFLILLFSVNFWISLKKL